VFSTNYDKRPFGFRHALADHPMLEWSSLVALAKRMPRDKVLHRHGRVPISTNFDRAHKNHAISWSLEETLERMEDVQGYVVLNTPEVDRQFKPLVDEIIAELRQRLEGVDSGLYWHATYLFLSASGSVTPYHMDREMNFLLQLRGSKDVQLWSPEIMTMRERERLMTHWTAPRPEWTPSHVNHVTQFRLTPGDGVHHPFIAPHLVENGPELSVSFAVTFRTKGTDRKTNVYKVNHHLRRLGLTPTPPEVSKVRDRLKSRAYFAATSLVHAVKPLAQSTRKRMLGA